MAPFHNVNCTHGFLLISSLGVLSICQLPPLFQFDNAWPLNKIPLRSTPHSVTLSPDAAHLFLVTSTPVRLPPLLDPSCFSSSFVANNLFFLHCNALPSPPLPQTPF
ncbi:unnamed protein product, partial [Closterium sp. NIES-53]